MTYTPALHENTSSASFYADKCIVLLPLIIWSVFAYGARASFITVISVIFALALYFAYIYALKKKPCLNTVLDIIVSACVAAFTLPVSVPYYLPMLGGIISALPSLFMQRGTKVLFGGFGAAAALRAFFSTLTARATRAFTYISPWLFSPSDKEIEPFRTYTPFQLLAQDKVSSGTVWDQFFGTVSGNIGEISGFLIVLGIVFLVLRRKMRILPSAAFVFTLGIITLVFPKGDSEAIFFMLVSLFSGGVMTVALFAFSDHMSLPITDSGKIAFALILAVLTATVRYIFPQYDGVYLAATVACLLTPITDKYTLPVAYGRTKVKKAKNERKKP